ncbi:MAG: Trk-type K+ transport system [Candidatus Nanosalina sp. J07AB43]|nr:MAG: Trk-type K+ transport system [Candidatus Nanosalina sp. J07AB43]
MRSALDLSQVPDVSIVLVTAAASAGLLGGESVALITLVVILTMAASSILISSGDLLASKFFDRPSYSREDTDAILLGSSENADTVFNILKNFYDDVIVVNRGTGTPEKASLDDTVYGDFSHEEIRQKAGSESAETIVTLKDDLDVEEEVIEDFRSRKLILLEKSPQLSLSFLDASADYVVNPELLAANELVERVKND